MEDEVARVSKKSALLAAESERSVKLQERLAQLLREAAQVEVELSRADGSIRGVPHYSVIEGRAHELGKQLSREVQQQHMGELAALQAPVAKCPACGTRCDLKPKKRRLKSVDGETNLQELVGYCAGCRRSFFPSA